MDERSHLPISIKAIFLAAREKTSGKERNSYLRDAVGEDTALLRRVEIMLAAAENSRPYELNQIVADVGVPTADQPMDSTNDIDVHSDIGPYHLAYKLGEGGMGEVFVAQQRKPVQRTVALKLIKRGMDSREVIARFEAERQALAIMDHPNVAKVLDAGQTDDGRPYFVTDLVRGIPITEYCNNHKLSTNDRLELLVSVCQAVQHAHQKGIIHRDLKPSNILVELHDVRHVPKVIDFGVAKAINQRLTERTLLTQLSQMVGTPLYMSPEQAELSGIDVDTRSDVYSLGVLMYELLTGTTPFDKETLREAGFDEMRRIIREDEPPRPSHRVSTLNAAQLSTLSERQRTAAPKLKQRIERELDWIVLKALEKDRTRRYESASSLAADIQRYLDDEAVEACPPSTVYRFGKLARRHKAALTTVVAVAVALLIGTVGTGYQAMRATKAEQVAVAEAARAESEAETAKMEAAISEAVNEFVNSDLLGSADPHAEPNRNLQVREVLDRAGQRLGDRFQDQPLIAAAIRHTLGKSYLTLRELDHAESQLETALQLYRQRQREDDAKSLQVESDLAWLEHERGEYQLSWKLFQSVSNRATKILGPEDRITLIARSSLADLTMHLGRRQEAEALTREVLEIQRRVLGPEDSATLVTMQNLSVVLATQSRSVEAEQLNRELLEIGRRINGSEHPSTLKTMASLAKRLVSGYQYAEAEKLLLEVLDIGPRVLGAEHPQVLSSKTALASVRIKQGRFEEAIELYADALELQTRRLGEEHPNSLSTKNSLAWANLDLARYHEAEKLFRESLEIWRRKVGSDHPETLASIYGLGTLYSKKAAVEDDQQGHYEKAKELLLQSFEGRSRILGEESRDTLLSSNNLAIVYTRLGENDKAEDLLRRQLEIAQRTLRKNHYLTLTALTNLAELHRLNRRYEQAGELYQQALDIRRESQGAEHVETLHVVYQLAMNYFDQGHYVRSEKLFRQVLKTYRSKLGEKHPSTLNCRAMLSQAVEKQDRVEEAEEMWRKVIAGAKPTWGNTEFSVQQLGRCWRKLLDEVREPRDADGLFRRATEFLNRVVAEGHDLGHVLPACRPLITWSRRDDGENVSNEEQEFHRLITNYYSTTNRDDASFLTERGIWHQKRGENQLALADFRAAQKQEPSDLAQRRIILLVLQQGDPRKAIEELSVIDEIDSTSAFIKKAALIGYAGEESLYRQLCERMLEKYVTSESIADIEQTCKLCALLPGATEPSKLPLSKLEKFLQQEQTHPSRFWYTMAQATARFRLGDTEKALAAIRESQAHEGYSQQPQAQAFVLSLLAMCEHELGHSHEAVEALDEATSLIEQHWPKVLNDEVGSGWPDWLIAKTLQREAAALIGK